MGISKQVKRISSDTEVIFESCSDAERGTPGSTRTLIGRAARTGLTHAGYRWEYDNTPQPVKAELPDDAISEDQLREMFNIRSIVFKELNALPAGCFYRDSTFVRKFQGKTGFRGVLESPEAQAFKGRGSGGVVFWGHPDSIRKMKNEGTLI